MNQALLAGLFALGLGAASAGAQGVDYQKPAGWDDRAEGSGRRLTAPASAEGELLTVALGSAPAPADPEALLTAWAEADLPSAADRSRAPIARRTEAGVLVLTLTRKVRDAALGDHERLYQLVVAGGRAALAKVTARGAATLDAQGPALLTLLAGLRPQPAAVPVPEPTRSAPLPPVPALPVPYGETPGLHPGDPDFRPSGRGRPLPAPGLTDQGPAGLWWTPGTPGTVSTLLFFGDGALVRFYRPGGAALADTAAMKAGTGADDVGTWAVSGGTLTFGFGGQTKTVEFVSYHDVLGDYFRAGAQVFRPAAAVTAEEVKGRWTGAGGRLVLGPDGTLQADAGTLTGGRLEGRWWAEGRLLIAQAGPQTWVLGLFVPLPGQLAVGGKLYRRE